VSSVSTAAEYPTEADQPEMALLMGGLNLHDGSSLTSMERYDLSLGQWSVAAAMSSARCMFGACTLAGEHYVTGGYQPDRRGPSSSVEKYTPSSDTWSAVASLPTAVCQHAAVVVGSALYVLGGLTSDVGSTEILTSVFKFDSIQGT
jgi:N-acetylneuraminic acid mutarotase